MMTWSQEMSKAQREPPKMNDAQTKMAAEIGEQMGKCMQAAMAGAEPTIEKTPAQTVISELLFMRERACACGDKACAAGVEGDLQEWVEGLESRNVVRSEVLTTQITELKAEAAECIKSARAAATDQK